MRKPIIAGNWKMYKSLAEAKKFAEEVKGLVPDSVKVDSIICAPALYLEQLKQIVSDSTLKIGAQTMHFETEGAFTGEVSPAQLAEIGVEYVILGHSERREYFNETDIDVNKKVHAAFAYEISPILCVGETLEEREAGSTTSKVEKQIERGLAGLSEEQVKKMVVAYEPIWAIGTGKTATSEDANEVCRSIRLKVEGLYGKSAADSIRIQYGGSVKPENIRELLAMDDIDGALVGGASLQPESFLKLLEAGSNA